MMAKTKKKSAGRPKKDKNDVRDTLLPVRFSTAELERLRRSAGDRTLTSWVRHRLGLPSTGYGDRS